MGALFQNSAGALMRFLGIDVGLDGAVAWDDLGDLLRDAYLLVAPKRLGALLRES